MNLGQKCEYVWRYMDFWKFMDLIQRKALYFSISSQQADPNEGSFDDNKIPFPVGDSFIFSCWHKNNHENILMWKTYVSGKDGIAIKIKLDDLKKYFLSLNTNFRIEDVEYLPIKNKISIETINGNIDLFKLIKTKTVEYISENEVKVFILKSLLNKKKYDTGERLEELLSQNDIPEKYSPSVKDLLETQNKKSIERIKEDIKNQIINPTGEYIDFNLDIIEEVVLYPQMSASIKRLVNEIKEKKRLNFSIKESIVKERI